jgi:DNA-binding CsgD family transcriptional regulator
MGVMNGGRNGEPSARHQRLREAAVALRRAGKSRREIAQILGIRGNSRLDELLRGEPAPAWTRRPNAKGELRVKARELRAQGKVYAEIAAALGVSQSSVSLWVRDMPKPPPRMTPEEHARHMSKVRWEPERRRREAERQATKRAAEQEIGQVSSRELIMAGAVAYWCEGSKDKSYDRREQVVFMNSDPGLIRLFCRFLDVVGVADEMRRYRLHIHETADVSAATSYWAEVVGVAPESFAKPTIKRHSPKTNRLNVSDTYRGCLDIRVRRSAELYRRIEGWVTGTIGGAERADSVGGGPVMED